MKFLFVIILLFSSLVGISQIQEAHSGTFRVRKIKKVTSEKSGEFIPQDRAKKTPQKEPIRTVKGPFYPGGKDAMQVFVSKNQLYPNKDSSKKTGGTIQIGFTVDKEGLLSNIKVLSGNSKKLNEEAVRIVKLMPNWIPQEITGIKVTSNFNIVRILLKSQL
jgi:TonB family protein